MEKLLHERLREVEHYGDFHDALKLGTDTSFEEDANRIADEIERSYIQLPCDPEGKPWKIGDEAISGEGETFIVQGVGYTDGLSYLVNVDSGTVYDAEWCKRPQPKILDADGVEIKVGDTVWFLYGDHHKFVVDRIYEDHSLGWIVADGGDKERYFQPTKLAHKEPDSLQKLLTDMEDLQEVDDVVPEWIDRLSALIERSA